MSCNGNLAMAKRVRDDEFYTLYEDVEAELDHYQDHFEGRRVYCNCDDADRSSFWRFFRSRFHELGLAGLVASCYVPGGHGKAWSYDGHGDPIASMLEGDGDFRSEECMAMLADSDIVASNPPFSLFRDYASALASSGKGFLAIGSLNAVTYKEVFPLIADGRIWLGYGHPKRFLRPGGGVQALGNVEWFTNLDIPKRHVPLELAAMYDPDGYPRYDNYDAIECGSVAGIPKDYEGTMGVPVTFLERHCPEQFDIVGITKSWNGRASKRYGEQIQVSRDGSRKRVSKLNDQPAMPRPDGRAGTYYICDGKEYVALYQRVLIRKR